MAKLKIIIKKKKIKKSKNLKSTLKTFLFSQKITFLLFGKMVLLYFGKKKKNQPTKKFAIFQRMELSSSSIPCKIPMILYFREWNFLALVFRKLRICHSPKLIKPLPFSTLLFFFVIIKYPIQDYLLTDKECSFHFID